MAIDIKQALIDGGHKYKKEMLTMPVLALNLLFPYMTLETGVQGKVTQGLLDVDAELRPYKSEKGAAGGVSLDPIERESFLGDVVMEFDPNVLKGSVYTEPTARKADEMDVARRVALRMAQKVGNSLFKQVFKAERDATGSTTHDLFNGFGTQVNALATAGTISGAKGNLMDLTGTAMTKDNAGDKLREVWENADPNLKNENTILYCPQSVVEMYEKWYQVEFGAAPWNANYEQMKLHGTFGRCQFAPLSNMEGTGQLHLSLKENMKLMVDQESDTEEVEIRRCDNPKAVQLYMLSYFGTGFETVQKEYFCAVKYS